MEDLKLSEMNCEIKIINVFLFFLQNHNSNAYTDTFAYDIHAYKC